MIFGSIVPKKFAIDKDVSQKPELLSTIVLYQNGPFMRVRRYYRGVHPQLGVIHRGYTGLETMVEEDVIKPLHTFAVLDEPQRQA